MKKKQILKYLEKFNLNDEVKLSGLTETFDVSQLIKMGYISKQEHPSKPLYIYNYTPKTQYEKKWNKDTILHRGLIKDKLNNIIARPFPKFFNVEELSNSKIRHILDGKKPKVYEKMDGSLAIVFYYDGEWDVATRGSFTSEQAVKAKQLLKKLNLEEKLDTSYTYLFEVIYPENRIVVDYGKDERMVYLAHTNTSGDIFTDAPLEDRAKDYGELSLDEVMSLKEEGSSNDEGFVCVGPNGLFKVKHHEYIELHKQFSNYSPTKIFEALQENESNFSQYPDELHKEIQGICDNYKTEFDRIKMECKEYVQNLPERREIAQYKYRDVIFAWLDMKDVSQYIKNHISKATVIG